MPSRPSTIVAKMFAGEAPNDMKALAGRYGTLFTEINKQWKEVQKKIIEQLPAKNYAPERAEILKIMEGIVRDANLQRIEAVGERGVTQEDQGALLTEMRNVGGEAYQVVGSLLTDLGKFGTEEGDKILDNLEAGRMLHTDVLPWPSYALPPLSDKEDRTTMEHPKIVAGMRLAIKVLFVWADRLPTRPRESAARPALSQAAASYPHCLRALCPSASSA